MRVHGLLIVILLAALFTLANALFMVDQNEQALVLQFGRPVRVVQEPGLQTKLPFVQNVEYYDKRLLDFYAEPKEVIAADQKRLIVDAFVRYRISDPLKFKQTVADERTMKSRLNALLEASLRQVIGGVQLAAVVSEQRAPIMKEIRELVNAQAQGGHLDEAGHIVHSGGDTAFGIEVADVRIMRADLPKENAEGIYRRMQTERERLAKQYRAQGAEDAQKIRSEAEKSRTILLAEAKKTADTTRGQGDAQAISILAAATGQDAEFYQFYRTLQAYKKTLNAQDTTLILSPDSEFLKYLDDGATPGK